MTMAAPVVNGWVRLVLVGDVFDLTRGNAAEFRHRGLTLVGHADVASALIDVGQDPGAVVLVPIDLAEMKVTQFVDVVRTLAHVPVIVGLTSEGSPQQVSELFDHGISSVVLLPATPARLFEAVNACRRQPVGATRLELGGIVLDEASFRVTSHGRTISLAPQIFGLLRHMMIAHPRVISIEEVAATFDAGGANAQDRARRSIQRLRRAFIDAGEVNPVVHVPRVGYRLEPGDGPTELKIEEHGNA